MAVKHGHFPLRTRKARLESFDGLWRKGNLRNEDKSGAPKVHNMPNRLQIYFRLPTASYPEKQQRLRRSLNGVLDRVDRVALFRIQHELGGWQEGLAGKWVARRPRLFQWSASLCALGSEIPLRTRRPLPPTRQSAVARRDPEEP